MQFFNKQVCLRIGLVGFLLLWAIFLLARPINLMVADLGRHLQNGHVLVEAFQHGEHGLLWEILETNFYSTSNASFPFVNHHWGSGVILYGIFLLGGFKALSIFFILLSTATFLLFFNTALKASNWYVAALSSVWLIPLLADRTEIRPELFSYFFALYFLVYCGGIVEVC